MGWLLLVVWPLEISGLMVKTPIVGLIALPLFALYLFMAFLTVGTANRVLAAGLVLGVIALSASDGVWTLAMEGLEGSMVFAAFLPAVFLLRNVMAGDRRVRAYKDKLDAYAPHERPAMLLVGSHVLGSALTVGAFAVIAPVVPRDADTGQRTAAALATLFGVGMSVLWSPVFVAMAIVTEFMPQIPLWQLMLLGFGLSLIGMAMALVALGAGRKPVLALRGVLALRSIVPMVALLASSVALMQTFLPFSTIEAASVMIPPLASLLLLAQPRDRAWRALEGTRRNLDAMGAEVSIVALAFALGVVMRGSPTVQSYAQGMIAIDLPSLLPVALIVGGMVLAGAFGGHPIVAASILLAVFAAGEPVLADIVIGGAILLGWACSAMTSPASLMTIVTTGLFRLERTELLFSRNTMLVLSLAACGIVLLAGLNALLK